MRIHKDVIWYIILNCQETKTTSALYFPLSLSSIWIGEIFQPQMKNGLVSVLLTGATYLRGRADNNQLKKSYAIVFNCFSINSHSKAPSQIYGNPLKCRKYLNHGPDSFKHLFALCATETLKLVSVEWRQPSLSSLAQLYNDEILWWNCTVQCMVQSSNERF